jgi:hypothetical protein
MVETISHVRKPQAYEEQNGRRKKHYKVRGKFYLAPPATNHYIALLVGFAKSVQYQ